jgi:hypothetical protein
VGRRLITLALAVDPVLAADLSRLCGSSVWESVRASVGECLRTWYAATDAHHKQCALAAMLATGSADFADILAPLLSDEDQQIRLSTYRAGDVFIPPASVPIGGASLTAGARSAASILFTRRCSASEQRTLAKAPRALSGRFRCPSGGGIKR